TKIGGELGAGYGAGTPEERRKRLLENLDTFGKMGGKYIISGLGLAHPDLKHIGSSTVTNYGATINLYEYSKAFPLYYLANKDCGECVPTGREIKIYLSKNGYYHFQVDLQKPQKLVLLVANLPGWEVYVDSVKSTILPVNGVFMGVDLTEGKHVVEFEYQGMLGELKWLKRFKLVRN
ncbi:MAG TPA: YfhO family protein, partial [Patescibacteria group bacterium]|nr:YfhO family protein [Patescibacteria group bacterium]